MEESNIYITDIYWDRIYLNIVFEIKNITEIGDIYLFVKNDLYEKLLVEKINKKQYKAKINITNVKNGKMFDNANYTIKILKKDEYINVPITNTVGYKLSSLDKIYRYKNYYAYTINIEVREQKDGNLYCVLKSRFMTATNMPTIMKIKKFFIKIFKYLFKFMFWIFNILHPNKKNKILLMSETRSPISGNLKALDKRLKVRKVNEKYKISYSFNKTLELNNFQLILKWIRLSWIISKQEKIFIDDYSPIFKYINLGKKSKLIQVWHAGVGFKSVGYARFGFGGSEPYESCHRKYDYAIVASKALIPVYSEVFGIDEEKILPYGLPRLDNYLEDTRIDKIKEKLYSNYSILKDKKIILFAPTFRGKGQKNAHYPFEKINLEETFKLCEKKNMLFIIKMHPFIKEHIEIPKEFKTRIIDFSDYPEINDLLYITDILITDYSSNIYDFSLLNRPILFYTFDLEKYELINKVHRPIKEYAPGKVCYTFNEILNAIYQDDFEIEKLERYKEGNVNIQKVYASDLIIDNLILKGEVNDIKNIN